MAATWTIAADTSEEAERQALPAKMMFAAMMRGELIAVPSVADAERWAATNAVPERRRRTVLGTAAEVRAKLNGVAALYGADELMLVNIMHDHGARVHSYELIAREYGLAELATAA
jgi:alkanesulfonate monooxygenase SsuD/methylene tetrahydromethanopterin reductase-like flavin-dependent oxidoreductase (luciferase family)